MRKTKLKSLTALIEAATSINNPYLAKAKEAGKKIVGLFYQEIPEEILTAAGCVPVLLRGTGAEGVEYAEAYFRQLTCNYTRCTFNQIIEGAWDFLDGAVIFNNCDHMRRIYDNWQLLPDNKAYCFFYAPKKRGALSKDFFAAQAKKLAEATEKKFGVKITDESLRNAIALHNETRRLQQRIYALQKGDQVALTGSELVMVMLAGLAMPKEDYNGLLRELLAELENSRETFHPGIRLLYMGGHVDNKEFFDLLGGHGADVVIDNQSYGTRSCEKLISENKDPFEAIVDYYFDERPVATRQFGTQAERMARIKQLCGEYRIDGVVMTRVSMCDIWAIEQFMARDYLSGHNIPLLELEVDYLPEGHGQIATRIQAFVESIKASKQA